MKEKIPIQEGAFKSTPDGEVLLANKCKACGQLFFPKVSLCLSCLHEETIEVVLSKTGKLYSYTIAHMPSTHFKPPYALGYIDMPEGVRIFAPLIIDDAKPFQVGMEMQVVIETLWQEDEKEIIGYKFVSV